ncbi:MAG: ribosome small subunit-dependent GTPase A [Limnohabitans sp.]|nr:ribosome small subunit-dependent GTPase A [Limnohabitans sp.]
MNVNGLVVASYGRHVIVESQDGQRRICHPRGKKNQAVVGDQVSWLASEDEGTIESVHPRKNLFYRQDDIRTKSFAANIDQILIFIAAKPEFSEMQITRALIAAQSQGIQALIGLNKKDIQPEFDHALQKLNAYTKMGYRVIDLSLKDPDFNLSEFQSLISCQSTLVLGPSGAGKSTLINRLIPGALAATNSISEALQSGKHTTTSTTWYWIDQEKKTALIDSPGFQEFGIHRLEPSSLAQWMPDLQPYIGQCKFSNCSHIHEPDCNIKSAWAQGKIDAQRYKIYTQLFEELSQPRQF